MAGAILTSEPLRRCLTFLTLLGLFLTVRGYRSREGDQAYRLPILLHAQDPRVYDGDPFVRAFDAFNPHRGYLGLVGVVSRPVGLSAALALLFVLTFMGTCYGIDGLARAVWGESGRGVGVIAVALVLVALAGNVGTNHLFEPILLDRLMAFGLGWLAIGAAVGSPRLGIRVSPLAVGLAALIHPSVGLQLAMLLGVTWLAWAGFGRAGGVDRADALRGVGGLLLAVLPGVLLNLGRSGRLADGLPPGDYWLLGVELQSPQHMLPHLWRMPQWLAWGCYPLLALRAVVPCERDDRPGSLTPSGKRLLVLLGVNLAGLAMAWYGIERLHSLRLTLFQPFRMATVARGLCLVLVAGHVRRLWARGSAPDRLRAVLIVVGLVGDWTLVVATLFEATMTACGATRPLPGTGRRWYVIMGSAVLAAGLVFLSRHDTESGHLPVLAAVVTTVGVGPWLARRSISWTPARVSLRIAVAWAVPLAAVAANVVPDGPPGGGRRGRLREALVRRCRFAEVPLDDVERLALWCRERTPPDARFVGPPGPKTFRLWSLRSLAFNRAAGPYHAAGLADWSRRFRDHVAFGGTNAAFVRAYLSDRHALECRYDNLSDHDKAALAGRQGAGYVVALAPAGGPADGPAGGPLSLLHAEGRYAVYRVNRAPQWAGRGGGDGGPGRRPR